jgi:hypothetical protein
VFEKVKGKTMDEGKNKSHTSPSLVLVGTVHRDPKGFKKLLRLLEKEAPSLITVEISPYALEFRAKRAGHLRATLRENLKRILREDGGSFRDLVSHGAIQGIFLLLTVPYEWRGAEVYALSRTVKAKPVDLSTYSEEKLAHVSELLSPENLRALLRSTALPIADQVISQYKQSQALWNHPPTAWPALKETEDRETHMAGEIRTLAKEGEKIVHVGGWEHFIDLPQGRSLLNKLRDLDPRRILLAENA